MVVASLPSLTSETSPCTVGEVGVFVIGVVAVGIVVGKCCSGSSMHDISNVKYMYSALYLHV